MSGLRFPLFLLLFLLLGPSAGLSFAIPAGGLDPGDALGLRLEPGVNAPQPGSDSVITMEPGWLTLHVGAAGARRAWLYYQPDAGEPVQYSIPSPGADSPFGFRVETATGGIIYVIAQDAAGKLAYSNALRVESGPYRALLQADSPDPRLRIEVNLPAFELKVFRGNQLLGKFRVGIGQKQWPVPPGLRLAHYIVWNPEWEPPNSPWATPALVRQLKAQGEVLGRIKIPLGGQILIHGTSRPHDLGRLVSHGCLRMLNRDVLQLGHLLVAQTGAPASPAMMRRAEMQHRLHYGVELPRPVVVAIRYQPAVLRAGKTVQLPDVYGWASSSGRPVASAARHPNRQNARYTKARRAGLASRSN